MGTALAAADRVIGVGFRGSDQSTDNIVVHTLTAAEHWNGSSQTVITGTWAASTADQPVRFATMQSGGTTWMVRANAANAPDKWDGTSGAFQNIAAATACRDILVSSGHLVQVRTTRNVISWSNLNDIDTFNSLNTATLDQTPGDIIAARNISPLSFAVYKDDAVFLASRQAAVEEFRFEFIASVAGPISVNSIIEFPWGHVWLGSDNAFYQFDGAQVVPLSRAMVSTLGENMHLSNRGRAHSAKRRRQQDEAWFYYPDASTGLVTRAVSVVIKEPTDLTPRTVALNPHQVQDEITASVSWRDRSDMTIDGLDSFSSTIDGLDGTWSTIDSMVSLGGSVVLLGGADGKFHEFGRSTSDNGASIAWEITHPHLAVGGIESRFFLDGMAVYWEKTTTALPITLGVTMTDSLSDAETENIVSGLTIDGLDELSSTIDGLDAVWATIDDMVQSFDLSVDSNHLVTFPNLRGKWAKIRLSGHSVVAGMFYRGMMVWGFKRGMV
tara:strand:- start:637 stop:2130 length:1494 start_codon:yes stop_codon:yes gene_type:complete